MPDTESKVSTLVSPSPTGDIIIRQFQPTDAPQVRALLLEGLVYGPGSPYHAAQRGYLSQPVACFLYLAFATGLGFLAQRKIAFRIAGIALLLMTTAAFFYARQSITQWFVGYCATARATDMSDIMACYKVPLSSIGVAPLGPGGYWVAVIESAEQKTSEVVGMLGLYYDANVNPTSGELRRMIVSKNHRRKRIGALLFTAVTAHARQHTPPLATLELVTTEYQPGAVKLYEKFGFSVVSTHPLRLAPFFSMTALRLRRRVVQ
ncbi:acyl-CoA N-acyltransferase [Mycena polygramma]|nr:acyl-CoA N-acyltransferase [Mycena polygramma]